MADRDQYWGIRAFNNRGTIPLNKDLQDVYVNVREKTGFNRNYPRFENCLRPVSHIDNQSSAKDSRYKGIVESFFQFIDCIWFEGNGPKPCCLKSAMIGSLTSPLDNNSLERTGNSATVA